MLRLTIAVLLNGGIFMTKYKRRNKSGLTTRKNYKTGKRAEQAGCGLRMGKGKVTRALKSSFNLIKRLVKSNVVKQAPQKIAEEAIKYVPELYEKRVSKVKNKSEKDALYINFTNTTLNNGSAYPQDILNNGKDITNFEIEKTIKK